MRPTTSRSDTNAWQSLRICFLALFSSVVFPCSVKLQAHGSNSDNSYRFQGVVNVQHIYSSFVKLLNRELMPNAVTYCPEFRTGVEGF